MTSAHHTRNHNIEFDSYDGYDFCQSLAIRPTYTTDIIHVSITITIYSYVCYFFFSLDGPKRRTYIFARARNTFASVSAAKHKLSYGGDYDTSGSKEDLKMFKNNKEKPKKGLQLTIAYDL